MKTRFDPAKKIIGKQFICVCCEKNVSLLLLISVDNFSVCHCFSHKFRGKKTFLKIVLETYDNMMIISNHDCLNIDD